MTKRLIFALIALASVSLSPARSAELPTESSGENLRQTGEIDTSSALALDRADVFSTIDGSVLLHGLPAVTLLDGRRFPISGELGRMGFTPIDLIPLSFLQTVRVENSVRSLTAGSDAVGGSVDLRLKRYSTGGEVGVFYGKSSGRYGREDFETYIIGGVGTDKFQITAGASYRESSGRLPRRP